MPVMKTELSSPKLTLVFLLIGLLSFSQLKGQKITLTYDVKLETCYNSNDAQITITAKGGSGNYSYSIDQGQSFSSGNVFTNLASGRNYVLVVKDDKGQKSGEVWAWVGKVDNPINLNVGYIASATCSNPYGIVNIWAWGGNGDMQYSLDGGKTFPYSGDNITISLPSGNYEVIARDKGGCLSPTKKAFIIPGSYSATLVGDTTVRPNTSFPLRVFITDASANSSTRYTITGKDNMGNTYSYNDLKVGANESVFSTPVSVVFTLLSVSKNNSSCVGIASGTATITVKDAYVWLGKSTDWHSTKNWDTKKVPGETAEVVINNNVTFQPVITSTGKAKNIQIGENASLTVTGTLEISGTMDAENDFSIKAENGTISFTGSAKQELNGNLFSGNLIDNLIFKNSVNLINVLNVMGTISFSGSNKEFNTNDNLTLKSGAEGTANVDKMINGNIIRGNVTVEQYFPARKGWKFISVSTQGNQTIQQAWQEGQPAGNTTGIKGYGIQLTNSMTDWAAKGFDAYSASPAIKTHVTETNLWQRLPSTLVPFNEPSNAYMVFVRGDRSSNAVNSPEVPTVLRSKGELKNGNQPVVNIPADKFVAIGNPYPSDIDLTKVNTSNDMFFYMWDQNLGNSYGAYQTFVKVGKNYMAIPGGGTYSNLSENIIPAGQAFFAYNKNGGSVQLTENSKAPKNYVSSSSRLMGGDGTPADNLNIKLYTGAGLLVDGVYQQFDEMFSNEVDGLDALKSANSTENLSIKRYGKLLAVESRSLNDYDTTELNVTGMSYTTYRLQFNLEQTAGDRDVILKDNYTGKEILIKNGETTEYEFEVIKNASSYAANRFRIIYAARTVMPVTFTSVKAEKKGTNVSVSWNIEEQKNVTSYKVERSEDGKNFMQIDEIEAMQTTSYKVSDNMPSAGINYYRIVSVDIDGRRGYSSVARINMGEMNEGLAVYPNPIAGNDINLKMNFKAKGVYYLSIRNQIGQVVDNRQINFDGNQTNISIHPATNLTKGVYTIDVTLPNGDHSVVRFIK